MRYQRLLEQLCPQELIPEEFKKQFCTTLSRASQVAQLVQNLPAMRETWV